MAVHHDSPGSSVETIETLREALAERDARIAELTLKVQTLEHRGWLSEACGDDLWGDNPSG